jgi:signal transduction histidine kinase/CheY-like chemotaxis protein
MTKLPERAPLALPERRALAVRLIAFGGACFVLARVGDALSLHQSGFSTFWPASGLLVAALLLASPRTRARYAVAGTAGGIAASLAAGRSVPVLVGIAAIDLSAAMIGALVARTIAGDRSLVRTVRGAVALLAAAALGPLTGAFLGGALTVLRYPGRFEYWEIVRQWWAGDGLGVLVFAPFALAWAEWRPKRPGIARVAEGLAVAAAITASAWVVYGRGLRLERSYLLLPPIFWAAARWGVRGATAAAVAVTAVSAWATSGAPLPSLGAPAPFANVEIQLLLGVNVATALVLAAALGERERALSELRAAQRLASIGTLAAGMAHEINNPLTYVSANLGHAVDRLVALRGDARVADALRALDDAADGTRRVSRIVRDLRAVSRIDGDARRPVDPRAEVERAVDLARNELRHRARLGVDLQAAPAVEAGEFQLGQVALNLLVNAAQAIPEGDADRHEVRVSTGTAPDGAAVIEVSDTGAGIPAAARPRIFEPFFTTKPVGHGTGLGLSVCHGIVTGLGGRIEVESEPGRGARFRVILPPAQRPSAPAARSAVAEEAAKETAVARERARVLVVDDEPLIGNAVRRILFEHDVLAMTDPREALRRLAGSERFDLVLCDLMMPGMTGMELHDVLARTHPEIAARLVFITGGAFTDQAREFLEDPLRRTLAKPFGPAELRELARAALRDG